MNKSISIAIHGSYFDNNFGDLLLLKIYENWVRKVLDCDIIYPMVPKDKHKKFKSQFPNTFVGLGEIKSWRALIYAGGGHFGQPNLNAADVYSQKWNQRFFKRHVLPAELCLWNRIPYMINGVGVGPLSNFFVRQEAKRIFNKARLLSVRDQESQQFVQSILGIRSNVEVIPDAALTITREDIPEQAWEKINFLTAPYKDMLLLGIHHPREFLSSTPQANSMRLSLFSLLSSESDILPIIFADNGKSEHSESGEKLTELIQHHTGKKSLSIPFLGVWETVALIANLSAVITTKLHVGIVAYALGVYCESFALHSKVPRFYKQIDRSSQCFMLEDVERDISKEKIVSAIQAARSESLIMDKNWEKVKKLALLNQKLIFSFLSSIL